MRKEEAKFETRFFSEAGADVAAKLAVSSAIEYFMLRPRFNRDVIKEIMEYANLKVKEKQKRDLKLQ